MHKRLITIAQWIESGLMTRDTPLFYDRDGREELIWKIITDTPEFDPNADKFTIWFETGHSVQANRDTKVIQLLGAIDAYRKLVEKATVGEFPTMSDLASTVSLVDETS